MLYEDKTRRWSRIGHEKINWRKTVEQDIKGLGGKHGMKLNRWPKIERTGKGALQLHGSLYPKRIYKRR